MNLSKIAFIIILLSSLKSFATVLAQTNFTMHQGRIVLPVEVSLTQDGKIIVYEYIKEEEYNRGSLIQETEINLSQTEFTRLYSLYEQLINIEVDEFVYDDICEMIPNDISEDLYILNNGNNLDLILTEDVCWSHKSVSPRDSDLAKVAENFKELLIENTYSNL